MLKVYVGRQSICPPNVAVPSKPSEALSALLDAHPREFGFIIRRLREHSKENGTIVSFWTNNPYIVCECDVDEVVVLTNTGQKSLRDHPKFNKWKDEFDPGEMWSNFGDDW